MKTRYFSLTSLALAMAFLTMPLIAAEKPVEGPIVTEGGTKNATKTWYADDLPDPGCQGAVLRHSWPEGDKPGMLLYSGPGVATGRVHGTLFGSYDDGKTWPWKQEYYEGPSGYSDVTALPDGRVAVLFENEGLGFTILPAPPATPPAEAAK
jgi:hypothetical protein